jgi:hypothetical protein
MSSTEPNQALIEFLEQRGYKPEEIEKILLRVAVHDQKMTSDSVFDSLGEGSFSIDDLIREALQQTPWDE